jgi:hypothetical protein
LAVSQAFLGEWLIRVRETLLAFHPHNETLSVAAMSVNHPDCSPFKIES